MAGQERGAKADATGNQEGNSGPAAPVALGISSDYEGSMEQERGVLEIGVRVGDMVKPDPELVPSDVRRAQFFCGCTGYMHPIAVVTHSDRLITYDEETGYTRTTRAVRAPCPRCRAPWVIEHERLFGVVNGRKGIRKLISAVASRT